MQYNFYSFLHFLLVPICLVLTNQLSRSKSIIHCAMWASLSILCIVLMQDSKKIESLIISCSYALSSNRKYLLSTVLALALAYLISCVITWCIEAVYNNLHSKFRRESISYVPILYINFLSRIYFTFLLDPIICKLVFFYICKLNIMNIYEDLLFRFKTATLVILPLVLVIRIPLVQHTLHRLSILLLSQTTKNL